MGSSAGCSRGALRRLRLLPGVAQAIHLKKSMCLSAGKVHCEGMADTTSADAVLRPETPGSNSISHRISAQCNAGMAANPLAKCGPTACSMQTQAYKPSCTALILHGRAAQRPMELHLTECISLFHTKRALACT